MDWMILRENDRGKEGQKRDEKRDESSPLASRWVKKKAKAHPPPPLSFDSRPCPRRCWCRALRRPSISMARRGASRAA